MMAEEPQQQDLEQGNAGISDIVRDTAGKPLKWTLWGMKLAGIFLWLGAIFLLVAAGLLFYTASTIKHGFIFVTVLVIGLFCTLGSCLSCVGASKLSFYRMMVKKLDGTIERGTRAIDAVQGKGENRAQVLSEFAMSEAKQLIGPRATRVLEAVGGSKTGSAVKGLVGSAGASVVAALGKVGGDSKIVKDMTTKMSEAAMSQINQVAETVGASTDKMTEMAMAEAEKFYAGQGGGEEDQEEFKDAASSLPVEQQV